MTDCSPDDSVEILLGTRRIEGTVDRVESRPGLNGTEDRIHVDAGESTIVVSPDQLCDI